MQMDLLSDPATVGRRGVEREGWSECGVEGGEVCRDKARPTTAGRGGGEKYKRRKIKKDTLRIQDRAQVQTSVLI